PGCFSTDWATLQTFSGGAANVCETGSPAIAGTTSQDNSAMARNIRLIEDPPAGTYGDSSTPPRSRYKALAPTAASGRWLTTTTPAPARLPPRTPARAA